MVPDADDGDKGNSLSPDLEGLGVKLENVVVGN